MTAIRVLITACIAPAVEAGCDPLAVADYVLATIPVERWHGALVDIAADPFTYGSAASRRAAKALRQDAS